MSRRAPAGSGARVGASVPGSSEPQQARRLAAEVRRQWTAAVTKRWLENIDPPALAEVLHEQTLAFARREPAAAEWAAMVAPTADPAQIGLQLRSACTFMMDERPTGAYDGQQELVESLVSTNFNSCAVYLPHPTLPVVLEGHLFAQTPRCAGAAWLDYSDFVRCAARPLLLEPGPPVAAAPSADSCSFVTHAVHWRSADPPMPAPGGALDWTDAAEFGRRALARATALGGARRSDAAETVAEGGGRAIWAARDMLRALQRRADAAAAAAAAEDLAGAAAPADVGGATAAAFADRRTGADYRASERPHRWQSEAPDEAPVWLTPEGGAAAARVPFPVLLTQLLDSRYMRVRAADFVPPGQNVFYGAPSSERVAYLTDRQPWIGGLGYQDFADGAAAIESAVADGTLRNVYTTHFPATDSRAVARPAAAPAGAAGREAAERRFHEEGHATFGERLHGRREAQFSGAYERLALAAAAETAAAAARPPLDRMLDFVLAPALYLDQPRA
jgi:hypothetical protein